jgi:hypothetical protein
MQNKLTVAKKAMWVVCCQTGVASNFVFWTFSYVVVIGLALNYVQLLLNRLLDFYETLHICSTLPADVHEGIWLLSKV